MFYEIGRSEKRFLECLLYAVRLEGMEYIDARADRHHDAFRAAIEGLKQETCWGPDRVPYFHSSLYTDRFSDLINFLPRWIWLNPILLGGYLVGYEFQLTADFAERKLQEETVTPEYEKMSRRRARMFVETLQAWTPERSSTPSWTTAAS